MASAARGRRVRPRTNGRIRCGSRTWRPAGSAARRRGVARRHIPLARLLVPCEPFYRGQLMA